MKILHSLVSVRNQLVANSTTAQHWVTQFMQSAPSNSLNQEYIKSSMSNPRDKPSVNFEQDPYIPMLLEKRGDNYGIVLVANWPPDKSFTTPYEQFVTNVRTCFRPEDLEFGNKNDSKIPAVYLYPPECLHITIATFTPFTSSTPTNPESFSSVCSRIIENCLARDDWPKGGGQQKAHIEIDRAQIGSKAGILLWKNKDGIIDRIRKIVMEEHDNVMKVDPASLEGRELVVPGIIHSTFLRFGMVPITEGDSVQQKFSEACSTDKIRALFGEIHVHSLRLVIEKIPYMHIPCDNNHVLAAYNFETE